VLVVHLVDLNVLDADQTVKAIVKVVVQVTAKVVATVVVVVVVVWVTVVVVVSVVVLLVAVVVVLVVQTVHHLVTPHAQLAVEAHVVPHVTDVRAALTAHHVTQLAHRDAHHALEDVKDRVMSVVRVVVTQIAQLLVKTHVLLTVQQHVFQLVRQQPGLVL